jgi:ABC-2 type transport system ATP-binding protein
MEEAETLCDRVAIMDRGTVVACDPPASLIAALQALPVLRTTALLPLQEVQHLPGVHQVDRHGQYLELTTEQPLATLNALHELAARCSCTIHDVMLRQPNLEDVFLTLTGHPLQA